jgi:phage baseplate assembly protein W
MKTVRQHWKMLLLTKPGEAMEDPSFGCGLMSFLFQNSTKDVVKTTNSGVVIYDDPRETIRLTIINQAQKYLGYLTVNDVEVNSIPDSNTLQVSIRYTLDVTGVSDAIDFDLSTVLTGELKSNPSSNAPDYYAQFD